MHRSLWFPGIFLIPPPALFLVVHQRKKNNPTRCFGHFFWGGFFFLESPGCFEIQLFCCLSFNESHEVCRESTNSQVEVVDEVKLKDIFPTSESSNFLDWFYPNVFGGKHEKNRFQTTYKDHLLATPGWVKPLEKRNKLFSAGFESWKKNKQRNDASIKLLPIYTFDHFEQKYADPACMQPLTYNVPGWKFKAV